MAWPRSVTVVARGHRAVRATHAKTLEVTADDELTAAGTCIVAVGADLAPARTTLAGPVRITITAREAADALTAVANPFASPGRRLVVRRSDAADADTVAGLADRGAADLDRDLVAALADPAAAVRVEITECGDEPAANALLALVPAGAPRPNADHTVEAGRADADRVAGLLRDGAHVAAVVDRHGLGRRGAELVAAARAAGAPVAVAPGAWEVPAVLLAAGVASPPHADLGTITTAATAPVALPYAARCDGRRLAHLLRALADRAGPDATVAVTADPVDPYRAPLVGRLGDLAAHPPDDPPRTVALAVVPAGTSAAPDVDRLAARLVADGVPVRTVADAVAAATGWPRSRAYDHVLRLKGTGGRP